MIVGGAKVGRSIERKVVIGENGVERPIKGEAGRWCRWLFGLKTTMTSHIGRGSTTGSMSYGYWFICAWFSLLNEDSMFNQFFIQLLKVNRSVSHAYHN